MQINYRWHGHAFPSLDAMFDPEWTATYAAQFLRTLYEERGSWSAAAGAYHSLSPELAAIYRTRFDRLLADLDPGALTDAETLVAAAEPDRRAQHPRRPARGAAAAMAERIRAAGPPPPSRRTAGSPGALFVPAAGALLVQGTPLLTQAQPLISAPPGGLF